MPPGEVGLIFDRFFRGSNAEGHVANGTGLGLAVTAAIVRGHGGSIDASCPPGGGLAVTVTLPLAAEPSIEEQLDDAAARNDMSPSDLADLLTTDPSAWVDMSGAVFFTDGVEVASAADPVSALAPLSETFQLHSRP